MPEIQYIRDGTQFEQALAKNKYLVANFTAEWCGPCQQLKPVVDRLYADAKYSKIEIVRVDLDACQAVAAQHTVTSVPTFIFFESGKEKHRVLGFSPQFVATLDTFAEQAAADGAVSSRGKAALAYKEIQHLIPKGFGVLNDTIHFGEMVALNVMPLVKHAEAEAKNVFKPSGKAGLAIFTDADSQALFFVPLNNMSKVYSVLIKFADRTQLAEKELELDADELADECQNPTVLKLWPNRLLVMSFDDAAADADAPHVEKIAHADGWYEAKLRYVRFQNVHNLNIFVDGADEDLHTLVEAIVLVGVIGDSRDQGSLAQSDE